MWVLFVLIFLCISNSGVYAQDITPFLLPNNYKIQYDIVEGSNSIKTVIEIYFKNYPVQFEGPDSGSLVEVIYAYMSTFIKYNKKTNACSLISDPSKLRQFNNFIRTATYDPTTLTFTTQNNVIHFRQVLNGYEILKFTGFGLTANQEGLIRSINYQELTDGYSYFNQIPIKTNCGNLPEETITIPDATYRIIKDDGVKSEYKVSEYIDFSYLLIYPEKSRLIMIDRNLVYEVDNSGACTEDDLGFFDDDKVKYKRLEAKASVWDTYGIKKIERAKFLYLYPKKDGLREFVVKKWIVDIPRSITILDTTFNGVQMEIEKDVANDNYFLITLHGSNKVTKYTFVYEQFTDRLDIVEMIIKKCVRNTRKMFLKSDPNDNLLTNIVISNTIKEDYMKQISTGFSIAGQTFSPLRIIITNVKVEDRKLTVEFTLFEDESYTTKFRIINGQSLSENRKLFYKATDSSENCEKECSLIDSCDGFDYNLKICTGYSGLSLKSDPDINCYIFMPYNKEMFIQSTISGFTMAQKTVDVKYIDQKVILKYLYDENMSVVNKPVSVIASKSARLVPKILLTIGTMLVIQI